MSTTLITEPFLLKLDAAIAADPDLNVSNLAVKAGLSNSSIRLMFKQNRSPRVETMRKISAALGTTLEEFMSNAQTDDELEIVHLLSQLDAGSRRELLGYGRALAAAANQSQPESVEEDE